jgi:N-acetyl-anhydromuramyl-L-alanine amidase AmpD
VTAPAIQDLTHSLKKHPTQRFPTRAREDIKRLIIHHTGIPAQIGADRIAAYRVETQGWPGIGYHFFITPDGLIQQTNDLTTVTTHAGPYNGESLAICLAGDFNNAVPTQAQLASGAHLIAWLLQQLNLPLEAVAGYKELANDPSPGEQWDNGVRWGAQLRDQIRASLSG